MNPSPWLAVLLAVLCAGAAAQTTVEEVRKQWPDFRYLDPGQLRELPEVVRSGIRS